MVDHRVYTVYNSFYYYVIQLSWVYTMR